MMKQRMLAWTAMISVATLAGCSDAAPSPGTVRGTISYGGPSVASERPLAIAVYRSFPPAGPPATYTLVERYELPYRYELTGLAPGRYWVGALLDVDRMDTRWAGMLNPARDPHGYAGGGQAIVLTERQGVAGADIFLEDPK